MFQPQWSPKTAQKARFAIISDCHVPNTIYKEYFSLALDTFRAIGDINGLLMLGDIIYQDGKELVNERYDPVMELLNEKMAGIPFVYTLGNHEAPLINENALTPELMERVCALFEEKVGQPVKYHTTIAGYHFITDKTVKAPDIAWIREKLEEAEREDAEKPIFLMLHDCFESLLTNTIRYSHAWRKEMHDLLQAHPRVVALVGHLHMVAQCPDIIVQDGFTVVQVPGLGETGFILGDGLFDNFEKRIEPQALLMEIENNLVTIYKLDLKNGECVGKPFVIDVAAVRDGKQIYSHKNRELSARPYFPVGSSLSVEMDGKETRLCFNRAENEPVNAWSQDDFVSAYRVEVCQKDSGENVFSTLVVSNYYRANTPELITKDYTQVLPELVPGQSYIASVTPIGAFRKEGEPLKTEFSVPVGANN